jgi:hypothetical protein
MKSIFFFILTSLLLFSCSNEQKDPVKERQSLIEELKKLHAGLSSKNKDQIQQLFSFPLADSIVPIYIDNTGFNEAKTKNNDMVSKEMFIKYFNNIYDDLQMKYLDSVLVKLNPEELKVKNELHYDTKSRINPCYWYYEMTVSHDSVELKFGSNSNPEFVDELNTIPDDEDIPAVNGAHTGYLSLMAKNFFLSARPLQGRIFERMINS